MSGEGGEGGEGGGKLPSVDHGRRTDEGRDKNIELSSSKLLSLLGYLIVFNGNIILRTTVGPIERIFKSQLVPR